MALLLAPLVLILTLSTFNYRPAQAQDVSVFADLFRVTSHEIGTLGNWRVNHYMLHESDALVLTRTAMGEAPDNLDDRILVMWLIKIRAQLGYKNGRWGFVGTIDRWGPPSSIKMEALCIGGCQFEVWRAAQYVIRPSQLPTTGILSKMLYPADEYLDDFADTYVQALAIVDARLRDAPEILRGYDGFLSPGASDTHFIDWKPNGLKRLQLSGEGGNVWIDHFKQDNHFWDLLPGRLALTPSAVPSPTSTETQVPTITPTVISIPTATPELLEPEGYAKVDPQLLRKETAVMEVFENIINAAGPQVTTILALVAGNTILGIGIAIRDKIFDWVKVADFYTKEVIPKGLGYVGVLAVSRFGALDWMGPELGDAISNGLEWAAWLAVVTSLGGAVLSKVAKLGLTVVRKIPGVT